jgi:hypothetical protein
MPQLKSDQFAFHSLYDPGLLHDKSYILEIMDELTNFLAQYPHIHHATPSSPDYDTLYQGYVLDNTKVPAVIVRPRSADDVATLVTVLKANDLPFSVRVGGHDMFGRSQVDDAITIDLRNPWRIRPAQRSIWIWSRSDPAGVITF